MQTDFAKGLCVLVRDKDGGNAMSREPARCNHTAQPLGYMEWHRWASKKAKTHRQRKCPHCGLWAIWVPKKSALGVQEQT